MWILMRLAMALSTVLFHFAPGGAMIEAAVYVPMPAYGTRRISHTMMLQKRGGGPDNRRPVGSYRSSLA